MPACGHYMSGVGFPPESRPTLWIQTQIDLRARPRGFHLVTSEVLEGLPELREMRVGIATIFIQHTSASLTLNENASPDVRADFAAWFDRAVPDGAPYFSHTLEGPDDMPAHVKSALTGSSLVIPVAGGRLALGTWQGIYLCEHRDGGGPRRLVVTAFGERSRREGAPPGDKGDRDL
jgi:secondary thiamine-phosphate synthase enzyme